jgi:8-oxo-dGTP pyrophosphatase MutT (NUDIX family)
MFLPFEGAGFSLFHKNSVILCDRIKKKKDALIDSTPELEYVGGKVEADETPIETAYAELVEELGGDPLQSDWRERAKRTTTFQPFSKKWIWNYFLELTDAEYDMLCALAVNLDGWASDTKRSFETLTGRPELARKAVSAIRVVPLDNFIAHIESFAGYGNSDNANRMKDAKAYGRDASVPKLSATLVQDASGTVAHCLRAFNLVLMEQHLDRIRGMAC